MARNVWVLEVRRARLDRATCTRSVCCRMPTLKEQNRKALAFVLAGNALALALLLNADAVARAKGLTAALVSGLGPTAGTFASIAVSVAGSITVATIVARLVPRLLPRETKHALVYLKWEHILPSYRMVELASTDTGINVAALVKLNGAPLPSDPVAQHHLWDTWYRSVEKHEAVLDAHGDHLFFRDWLMIGLLFAVFFSPLVFFVAGVWFGLFYLIGHIVQFALAAAAARDAGHTMVRSVMAIVAAKPASGTPATSP